MRRMALALGALAMAAGAYGAGHAMADGPRGCAFDGGGTIASGDAARTDTGMWACADGELYRLP